MFNDCDKCTKVLSDAVLICLEFALNSLIKENKDEFEMSAQVEEWENLLEKVRKM